MTALSRALVTVAALVSAGAANADTPDPDDDDTAAIVARAASSESFDDSQWITDGGYAIQIDNDFFSGASRDQDYSWGGGVTYSSPQPGKFLAPLHRVRAFLDRSHSSDSSDLRSWTPGQQATQISLLAFTPGTLRSPEPIPGERPYASLLYAASSKMRVLEGGNRSRFSSFTVGILGLDVAKNLQAGLHKLVGNERPQGWDHQISDGGEPTARYVEAQQWLLSEAGSGGGDLPEVKFTLAGSIGYQTEASVAFSTRWGRVQSPWWSFAPELGDYTSAPLAPVTRFSSHNPAEMFGFAGFRLKARAYNAFLQGQFRHSDLRVASEDVAHFNAEAWIGFASTWSDLRVTYTIRYTSAEMTTEPGSRGLIWAGINFEKSL